MPDESTTPELEDAVRRSLEAFARRDFDAVMTLYAPNTVWDAPRGVGVWEGRAAVRGLFEDWRASYEDFEQVLEEFRDLGQGVTLVAAFQRARLPGSSGLVELRYATVSTWADGLVERTSVYTHPDRARAAAERLAEERG